MRPRDVGRGSVELWLAVEIELGRAFRFFLGRHVLPGLGFLLFGHLLDELLPLDDPVVLSIISLEP